MLGLFRDKSLASAFNLLIILSFKKSFISVLKSSLRRVLLVLNSPSAILWKDLEFF